MTASHNTSPKANRVRIPVLTGPDEGMPPGLEPLQSEAELVHAPSTEALIDAIADAPILLVTDFRTGVLGEAWPHARKLEWIHATSAGVDAILIPELVESDVVVTNARGIFDRSIAEYVLGLILAFAKDFMGTFALQREATWQHRDSERVEGKEVLLIGAGPIAREIARMVRCAGIEVSAIARTRREDDPDFGVVHAQDTLHTVLAEADYVVIAAPLTPGTQHMFSRGAFKAMKPSARLINIGRGPIVDTGALIEALDAGDIAGAALDVFEEEPLPPEHPLWRMPQVIVSHHMAGDFIGWREALSAQFIANFRRWRAGEPLMNVVDKRLGYVPVSKEGGQ